MFLTGQGKSKEELREYLEKTFGYDLHRTIEGIRPGYTYDVSCMGSVPEAIIAYLFQPFFKIALGRDVWNVVDVGIACLLLWTTWKEWNKKD